MDFSEDWKSLWTVSSVYEPPLLISNPYSSKSLGPLLFTPLPKTLHLLSCSSLLSFPFSLPPFHKPPHPHESNEAETTSQSHRHDQFSTFNNTLQMLRCSKHDILLFFPYGDCLDRVGFAKVSLRGSHPEILDDEEDFSVTEHEFDGRVRGISVSSVVVDGIWDFYLESGNSIVIGFLLAWDLDCVYWYRVEIGNTRSDFEKPVLAYLGCKKFSLAVTHACWNPHLPEESLVLLENGDLLLFDMESCSRADKFAVELEGTRISVSWDTEEEEPKDCRWLSCTFSWHPRIIVVASCSTIFLVDWRLEETNICFLAKVEMFHLNRTVKESKFVTFCNAGSDGFYYAVATQENLFLIDIRKPMMSVLQWAHGLDNPHYINVFRLSELRSRVKDNEYKCASDSGFAIVLGSFLNCNFSLFFYGLPLPAPDESISSEISKLCNSLYAWDIPSEFSVLGHPYSSGNCILAKEFSSTTLPEWRKEKILGFCVIDERLLGDQEMESDGLSGFTLLRLVSSGKLESQRYSAVRHFTSLKLEKSGEKSSHLGDSFLDLFIDQKYKFPRRFRYLHLESLLGFLNNDLPEVLMSKMKKSCPASNKRTEYTRENCEIIRDILRAAGVDIIGFCPAIETLLKDTSWPMNIHEINSCRMWGGLNVDLLQLAFTIYSELVGVLIEHRRISLEALEIPKLPQLPPFFSKVPTIRSSKWSWSLQLDDILVGPILPLPYLLALPKVVEKNCLTWEEEKTEDEELAQQCNEIMTTATKMALLGSGLELNESPVVSLANDREETWGASKESKAIFFHKPSAFSEAVDTARGRPVYEDEKYDTFISKAVEKESTSNLMKEAVGLNMFDDLCPIQLNFVYPEMNFGVKEEKGYKLLKRKFSKWQEENNHYQDFCKSLKIQKRV